MANSSNTFSTTSTDELYSLFNAQKVAFAANIYPSLAERMDALDTLLDITLSIKEDLADALEADFHHQNRSITAIWELGGVIGRIEHVRANLASWMKHSPRELSAPQEGAYAEVRYQPKGVIGNMVPWNFPGDISLGPLVDILAAGNRCIIKPSDLNPHAGEVIRSYVNRQFPEDLVGVVTGGMELSKAFASVPFDHLLFTGGPEIARQVMRAAAENLTPVTLELGGKTPAIVVDDAITRETFSDILAAKAAKSGQVCITTDYVFIPEERLEESIALMQEIWAEMFPTFVESPEATGIINMRHFERLTGYLEDARAKGVDLIELNPSGETANPETRKFPLTLAINPGNDTAVMQNEIFGPILPVKTYREIDQVIDFVNAGHRPLALYIFTNTPELAENILSRTISGGASVNAAIMQAAHPALPFGGIGNSGMGCHHGHEGFLQFSHARSVFHLDTAAADAFGRPPYSGPSTTMIEEIIPWKK